MSVCTSRDRLGVEVAKLNVMDKSPERLNTLRAMAIMSFHQQLFLLALAFHSQTHMP